MYLEQLTSLKYLRSAFIWIIGYFKTTNKQSNIHYNTS